MREDVEPIARDAYWTDIPWLLGLLTLAALAFAIDQMAGFLSPPKPKGPGHRSPGK